MAQSAFEALRGTCLPPLPVSWAAAQHPQNQIQRDLEQCMGNISSQLLQCKDAAPRGRPEASIGLEGASQKLLSVFLGYLILTFPIVHATFVVRK